MAIAARMTSKGQLTVPKAVRERLGLRPGDEVEFDEVDGVFRIRKRIRRSPFDRYVGYLGDQATVDPDAIVRELRGHDE